jgi:hypothetical protein
MVEGRGERATGTPNTIYDLSSVLFHALEGGASYDTYIEDAEEADDQELADFFRRIRDEDSNRADEAQRLIAERTSTRGEMEDTAVLPAEGMADVSSRMETSTGASLGIEGPTSTRTGEAPPTMEEEPPRTEPISAAPRDGDVPPRRTEETPPLRPESSGDLPGTGPIGEEVSPSEEPLPPPRTAGIEEGSPAEAVPSGLPPQAPPGDVQRETSPERSSRMEEEREEDKGLVDKAKDYLLGEGREKDYLRGEDRERQDRER